MKITTAKLAKVKGTTESVNGTTVSLDEDLTTVASENATEIVKVGDESVTEVNKTVQVTTVKPVKTTSHSLKKQVKKVNKEVKDNKKSKKLVATTSNPDDQPAEFDDSNAEDEEMMQPGSIRNFQNRPKYNPVATRRNYWSRSQPASWRSNEDREFESRLASWRSGPPKAPATGTGPGPVPEKSPDEYIIGNVSSFT